MAKDDRIGKLGENEFDTLCERERLYASKLLPDRTGKDFIVEWPRIDDKSLDTRPPPRRCHVQIKSTRTKSSKVKITLSAAEWLVKDLTPSFVLCPVFNTNERIEHFVGFHIHGELLARFLKRLRQTEHEGGDPRRRSVTLSLIDGERLTEQQVRPYLEREASTEMASYSAEKALALKTMGYDDDGPEYEMTLTAASMTELVDGLMGKTTLHASIRGPKRTRFGIRALDPGESLLPPEAFISIQPNLDQAWRVAVIGADGSAAATTSLLARSVAIPGLAPEHWRSEAKNDLIEINIEGRKVSINFVGDALNERSLDLDDLIENIAFWSALLEHDGNVRVETDGGPVPRMVFGNLDTSRKPMFSRSLYLLECLKQIYEYCGVDRVDVDFGFIETRDKQIVSAAQQLDLREAEEPLICLQSTPETIADEAVRFEGGATVLLTFCVDLGRDVLGIAIAYSMTAEIEGEILKLSASSRFPLSGRCFHPDSAVSEYNAFVEAVKSEVSPALHAHNPLIDGRKA